MIDLTGLKYDDRGLIPVIAQSDDTGEVLMMAWANEAALRQTLETRRMTYWSRSRQSFWVKGETSGHTQEIVDLRIDCDQDAVLAVVKQTGAACHTNRRNCFYTSILEEEPVELFGPDP